jgi:hypothetical protein
MHSNLDCSNFANFEPSSRRVKDFGILNAACRASKILGGFRENNFLNGVLNIFIASIKESIASTTTAMTNT